MLEKKSLILKFIYVFKKKRHYYKSFSFISPQSVFTNLDVLQNFCIPAHDLRSFDPLLKWTWLLKNWVWPQKNWGQGVNDP